MVKISDENHQIVLDEAMASVNKVLVKTGLQMSVVRMSSFDERGIECGILIQTADDDGIFESVPERDWRLYSSDFNLKADLIGKTVQIPEGEEIYHHVIKGLGSGKKYPVITECIEDGVAYRYDADTIIAAKVVKVDAEKVRTSFEESEAKKAEAEKAEGEKAEEEIEETKEETKIKGKK